MWVAVDEVRVWDMKLLILKKRHLSGLGFELRIRNKVPPLRKDIYRANLQVANLGGKEDFQKANPGHLFTSNGCDGSHTKCIVTAFN